MLPRDLVLVRHGQSEGNLANRKSEGGDHTAFDETFRARHSSSWRLTDLGKKQAYRAGHWLEQAFGKNGFDRYMTSEYARAMETAAMLRLPNAEWFLDPYLIERDWGELEALPQDERQERFGNALLRRQDEPFFWRPPNGERFVELCLRVDRVLHTLHRECSDMRVLIVCHGEVMRAFQVRLERMSQARFRQVTISPEDTDRIHNCQIIHYTRTNPETNKLQKHAGWTRWIRPADDPPTTAGWQQIVRPRYTNNDLRSIVDEIQPTVTT